MPFAWGVNDCCLFAADAVLALTGKDVAADVRGSYSDALGAARIIDARGGLSAIATAALGASVLPVFAAVGDVVLLLNEGREMLAICNGTSAVAPGPDGMAVTGMDSAIAVWKV